MATVTNCSDFGAQENKVIHFSTVSQFIYHEAMGPDAMVLVFRIWVLSQLCLSPLSLLSRGALVLLHILQNALVTANTLFQHKRLLYTWTLPNGQYWNQIDYILCSRIWRSSLQSAKSRPGADWGSDHELFIAKFRLKLKRKPLDHSGMTSIKSLVII